MLTDFTPARFLRNPHVQSVLASLRLRRPFVMRRARELLRASESQVIDCGGGVRLHGYYSGHRRQAEHPDQAAVFPDTLLPGSRESQSDRHARRLVVLIHGWEGSADSLYQLSAAAHLYARGFDVFRLNLRDHGASHHLNVGIFHSCRLDEVVGAVQEIARRFPQHELYLAGFSLGGNFALRVAARAREAGLNIKRVVAVCPVLDPVHTLEALESGWPGYRRHFVGKWKRSLRLKQASHPEVYDFDELLTLNTLTEMTDYLVRRHSEFPDLAAYLSGYGIVDGVLRELSVPAHVIVAADDPIIPFEDIERLEAPACLTVEATAFGGHCGYIHGLSLTAWIDDRIYDALARDQTPRITHPLTA